MKKKTNPEGTGTLNLAAIQKLVDEVRAPFANVVRLTAVEKKRMAKMKRGAHEILPLIAQLAKKYAVQAPGTSVDDITSSLTYAQSLEPLLGSVTALQGTLNDAHTGAESTAWKTGTVSYAMMKKASRANVNLANELKPVTEWFRHHAKGTTADGTSAKGTKTGSTKSKNATAETTTSAAPTAGPTTAPSAQPEAKANGAPAPAATTPVAATPSTAAS